MRYFKPGDLYICKVDENFGPRSYVHHLWRREDGNVWVNLSDSDATRYPAFPVTDFDISWCLDNADEAIWISQGVVQ